MRVVIFGATGRTGICIVREALEKGYSVAAYVRDPKRLEITHEKLSVAVGELTDQHAVGLAVAGQDVVIVALGTGNIGTEGVDDSIHQIMTNGLRIIVQAMADQHVQKTIVLLSGWIFYEEYPMQFRGITREHEHMWSILMQSSLDWIAVCPPAVTDDPARPEIRIAIEEMPGQGYLQISKYNIARFVVEQIANSQYHQHAVGIAD